MIEKHMEQRNDELKSNKDCSNDEIPAQNNNKLKNNNNSNEEEDDEIMREDPPVEYHHERNNSLPEIFGDEAHQNDWEKYWAKNGERLIWQSWIDKYIDYINPEYLDKENMQFYETTENTASADTHKLDGGDSTEQVFTFDAKDIGKFNQVPQSYCNNEPEQSTTEIVISPPPPNKQSAEDLIIQGWNQLSPDSITKQEDYHNYSHTRHYQQHHHRHNNHHNTHHHEIDNLLSPRCESINSSIPLTLGTATDSMTNVTRMTISSYGFGSSHVTSDSTPSTSSESESNNTISSFSDSEESDNQMTTRVANECEQLLMKDKPEEHIPPSMDKDSEEYWQMKWQQHVQEMYVMHYNEFMEAHRILQDEMSSSFKSDSGFLPGESAIVMGGKFSNKRRRKPGRKKHSLQRLVASLNLRSDLTSKCSQKCTQLEQQPQQDDEGINKKEEAPTDGDDR